ncbi:MAG: hypothetical protein H6969_09635 [Gammaproteobacteria bacterium]|nr:hypothetical protein [Gammaproteobacteria bacterium]
MFTVFHRQACLAALLAGCWLPPYPAWAHQLRVFATADGDTISGAVYFAGGVKIAGAQIGLFDSQGTRLSETTSAEGGLFQFTVTRATDYRVVADAGDGHMAEFTLTADEFPDSPSQGNTGSTIETTGSASDPASHPASPVILSTDAQRALEHLIARQIRPLREQLDNYEQKVRWHDVLGGIGYILGLTGVAFFWLGYKRQSPKD